ncbi:MAG: YggT family protein [Granulosicoccaceae bacterium]|jgi:YggT family protein
MGSSYLLNPLVFLIDTLFGLYILIVMLRFLLQCTRADFYNPISQFLVKATNAPLRPLRRLIPGWGGIDIASLVLVFGLQLIALTLLLLLSGATPTLALLPGLLMATLTKLVSLLLYVYVFSIFILVILSWVSHGGYNPVAPLLHSITAPLMRPAQRMIPPIGGIDLSPMVVLIALYVLRMLIIPPLQVATLKAGFPAAALGLL